MDTFNDLSFITVQLPIYHCTASALNVSILKLQNQTNNFMNKDSCNVQQGLSYI